MRKIKTKTRKKELEVISTRDRYPYFSIELEHLPEAKKWEIGKTYNIGLEIKMTGINIREDTDGDGDRGDSTFEIRGIEPSLNKKNKLVDTLKRFKKQNG